MLQVVLLSCCSVTGLSNLYDHPKKTSLNNYFFINFWQVGFAADRWGSCSFCSILHERVLLSLTWTLTQDWRHWTRHIKCIKDPQFSFLCIWWRCWCSSDLPRKDVACMTCTQPLHASIRTSSMAFILWRGHSNDVNCLFLFVEKYRPDPFPIHTVLADFYVRWRHWQSFKTRKTVQRPEIQGAQSEQLLLSNTSHRWKFSTVVRQGASWEPFQGLGCRLRLRLWQTLAPKKRENISVHFVLWHSFGAAARRWRFYLGSPALATRFIRPRDRAILFEASRQVYSALQQSLRRLKVKDPKDPKDDTNACVKQRWNKDAGATISVVSTSFDLRLLVRMKWGQWTWIHTFGCKIIFWLWLACATTQAFFKQFRPFCVRFDSVWCFLSVALCPEEVLVGHLGGPGLVLMDPPYEPYNEYLTWNLYTIHMLLGSTWIWIYLALLALLAPALNLWDHASRVQIKSLQLS